MERLAAIALIVSCLALPACAQRGAAHGGGGSSGHPGSSFHGGFSGHAGSAFHGGFAGRPVQSQSYRGVYGPRPGRIAPPLRYGYSGGPGMPTRMSPRANAFRQPYTEAMRQRMPYDGRGHRREGRFRDRGYGWGAPYWGGYVSPYLPGYFDYPFYDFGYGSDDFDDDNGQGYANDNGYGGSPYDPGDPGQGDPGGYYGAQQYPPQPYPQQQYAPPYPQQQYTPPYPQQQFAPPASAPSSSPAPTAPAASTESPITVVFKDGRPPEKVQNYLLTSTTLSVLDQHRHDIPVDQIDLAATAKVNRDAGADFLLPPSSR